jgi:hypothetical protein
MILEYEVVDSVEAIFRYEYPYRAVQVPSVLYL